MALQVVASNLACGRIDDAGPLDKNMLKAAVVILGVPYRGTVSTDMYVPCPSQSGGNGICQKKVALEHSPWRSNLKRKKILVCHLSAPNRSTPLLPSGPTVAREAVRAPRGHRRGCR